jgi:hypothetical protein
MKMKWVVAMMSLSLIFLAAGCANMNLGRTADPEASGNLPSGIPLAPDFRIADIPVPANFQLVREGTFVFQNPLLDVGQIRYAGKEPLTSVAQFYIDEMPRYGWKLLNMSEHESIVLSYDKPDKSATVLVSPKGRGSIVEISFFPKSTKPAQI